MTSSGSAIFQQPGGQIDVVEATEDLAHLPMRALIKAGPRALRKGQQDAQP